MAEKPLEKSTSLIRVGEEVQKVKAFFAKPIIKEGLRKALPQSGITFDRLMGTLIPAIHKNPNLLLCERGSLFQSVVRAAQLGLEIDSPLGHAYLVPFKQTVQLIIGYKGLITLAYRDPHLVSLYAYTVGTEDEFDYGLGTKPFIQHKPNLEQWTLEPEVLRAVYAVAKLRNGGEIIEIVPGGVIEQLCADQLAKHRGESPWRYYFGAQARKTAIRRISNHLPKSADDSVRQWYEALDYERKLEMGQTTDVVEIPESPELSKPFVEEGEFEETRSTEETAEALSLTVKALTQMIEGQERLCITGSTASLAAIRTVLTTKKKGLDAQYKPLMEKGKLVEVRYLTDPTKKNKALLKAGCQQAGVTLIDETKSRPPTARELGFPEGPARQPPSAETEDDDLLI